jgi:hypothetical protein
MLLDLLIVTSNIRKIVQQNDERNRQLAKIVNALEGAQVSLDRIEHNTE